MCARCASCRRSSSCRHRASPRRGAASPRAPPRPSNALPPVLPRWPLAPDLQHHPEWAALEPRCLLARRSPTMALSQPRRASAVDHLQPLPPGRALSGAGQGSRSLAQARLVRESPPRRHPARWPRRCRPPPALPVHQSHHSGFDSAHHLPLHPPPLVCSQRGSHTRCAMVRRRLDLSCRSSKSSFAWVGGSSNSSSNSVSERNGCRQYYIR